MIEKSKENLRNAIKELIYKYQYDIIKIEVNCKKSQNSIEIKVLLEEKI
jgi:hypothetical protein